MLQSIKDNTHILAANIPVNTLVTKVSKQHLWQVAHSHHLTHMSQRKSKDAIVHELLQHKCDNCDRYVCNFELKAKPKVNDIEYHEYRNKQKAEIKLPDIFPPSQASSDLIDDIVQGFATNISNFHESACAVCAQLIPQKLLLSITKEDYDQNLLMSDNMVTVKERKSASDPICDIPGPVLLPGCDNICQSCLSELKEGRTPADSLANGLWLGEVPPHGVHASGQARENARPHHIMDS